MTVLDMNARSLPLRLVAGLALLLSGEAIAQPGRTTYFHTDGLGSVVAITNEAAEVIERREYEPFGLRIGDERASGPGYTGHVHDLRTGLDYMQQRYYDPQLGVFLSVDPVSAYRQPLSGLNRYAYANNSPYNYVDPDGRWGRLISKIIKRLVGGPTPRKAPRQSEGSKSSGKEGDGNSDGGKQSQGGESTRHGGREPRFPDNEFPRKKGNEPAPDPDAKGPHSQLGQEDGRKGKYDVAREFDGEGRIVRDIHFTSHGRANHPNPHQHRYTDNATGGTRQRGTHEPLD